MIRMLLVTPFSKDANSFHRALGPWSYLTKMARREGFDFEFFVAGEDTGHKGVAWDTVGQYDLVFMHRPCRTDDLTILRVAKNKNVPVWVEYDDWLFDVPPWNPHAGVYNNAALQNIIATCLACADVVSVTTSALYDQFRKVNPNVVIIPNAYRSDLYPYRQTPKAHERKEIAWRGTNTHDADMWSVAQAWSQLPGKVNFYGGPFWLVLNEMQHRQRPFQVVGSQDPFEYMRNLYNEAPRVLVAPLVDCLFNRAKSNIAYQEAMHAGALCVAPDMPEWKRPGVVTYQSGNAASFQQAVSQVFDMGDQERDEMAEHGFQDMRAMYDASVINQIRKATLLATMASDFERNNKNPMDQLLAMWAMAQLKGQPGKSLNTA